MILMILTCSLTPVSAIQNQYKVVVFDGFALFDPGPAAVVAEQIYSDKPAAQAYQLGLSQPQISIQQTLYVPFAGGDAGAVWHGYPLFCLNSSIEHSG